MAALGLLFVPLAPQAQMELQEARLALVRQGQILANTAATVIGARARDIDSDGQPEPPGWRAGSGPAGGGLLPAGTAAAMADGYGTPLGYCAWDHGAGTSAANMIAGRADASGPLLAVVFAGPNRVFDTACADIAAGLTLGDDYVSVRDINQTVLTAGVSLARPAVPTVAALQGLLGARNDALAAGRLDPLLPGEMRVVTADNSLWRFDPAAGAGGTGDFVRITASLVEGSDLRTGGGNVDTGGGNIATAGGSIDTGAGSLTVGGDTRLTNARVGGTLTVTGISTFNDRLTTLNGISTTTLTASGRVVISGELRANAGITTSVVTASGLVTAGGGLTTGGGHLTTGAGNLTVGGITTLSGAAINGALQVSGPMTANGGLIAGSGGLVVAGLTNLASTSVSGSLGVIGTITGDGGALLTGDTRIKGATRINTEAGATTRIGNPDSLTTIGGRLDVVGDLYLTGNFYGPSDARFKTHITALTGAAALLERLRGVSFDWNRAAFPERQFSARSQLGLIAQQVEAVVPELVETDAQGFKSVNYIGFVPLLIEGVKEQQGTLRDHATRLADHARLLQSQGVRIDGLDTRLSLAEKSIVGLDERTGRLELRLGRADEAIARLIERADRVDEFLAARFDASTADTLAVRSPTLKVSNLTAERARIEELVARRLEAEEAQFTRLEADEGRMTGSLQAQSVTARRVATGEREIFVSFGTIAPLFEVPEGAHFVVTLTASDGSYASATVVRAAGQLRVMPTAAQGIELVPHGTQVGVVAPSKKVKASWLRTG